MSGTVTVPKTMMHTAIQAETSTLVNPTNQPAIGSVDHIQIAGFTVDIVS